MKHITTLKARNLTFEIVKDEKGFWAIESKYITDGKLNQQINGISGNLRDNLADCIESARTHAEVDYLVNVEGWELDKAVVKAVMG